LISLHELKKRECRQTTTLNYRYIALYTHRIIF